MRLKVGNLKPGSSVQLKVFRDGTERDLSAVLGEAPVNPEIAGSASGGPGAAPQLGIQLEPASPQVTRPFGLPAATRGLVITSIQPGSTAEDAGLEPGDVIQEVNRQSVNDVAQFQRLVGSATGPVLLLIDRKGEHRYVTVRVK
jgi:serine protease Do